MKAPIIDTMTTIKTLLNLALLAEVTATPKPGLVDRHDNGAHRDMNVDLFVKSADAIAPWLALMARQGMTWPGAPETLLPLLRATGQAAEQRMLQATNGVNTHKGAIFTLGLLAAGSGLCLRQNGFFSLEDTLLLCSRMTRDSIELEFEEMTHRIPRTAGEHLYRVFGIRGVRGLAQAGFPVLRTVSCPLLRRLRAEGATPNDCHVNVLLALMAKVQDTCLLHRAGNDLAVLQRVQMRSARALALGGALTAAGMRELWQMNEDFNQANLSPGGCADLLAATIFLCDMEEVYG